MPNRGATPTVGGMFALAPPRAATLAGALVAGTAMAWGVGSCGSADPGALAKEVTATASTERSETTTVTQPAKTVTQPQQTVTATKTTTVAQPSRTSTVTNVQVTPTSTTGGDGDGGGMAWWGWVLIGLGVAGIGGAIFALGRHHGRGAPPPPVPG